MTFKLLFPALLLVPPILVSAQHTRTASLTEAETELVRESAILPDERVKLYTKFLDDRAAKIKALAGQPRSGQRVLKMDERLQDFTALMDETGDNLDQYSERHSDIRKSLKLLTDAMPKWLALLRGLPGESGFDLARKEAIESGQELSDQAIRLLHEEEAYFLAHKDDKNQERDDDKPKPDAPKP